ncbi:MAG: hypothetical protein AAF598_02045 [Bacteroidota bacterium]
MKKVLVLLLVSPLRGSAQRISLGIPKGHSNPISNCLFSSDAPAFLDKLLELVLETVDP